MMELYLAFQDTGSPANTNKTWNDVKVPASSVALLDSAGAASGITLDGVNVGGSFANNGTIGVGTGDAAWVDEQIVATEGHRPNSVSPDWTSSYDLSSVPSGSYDIEVFCNQEGGRITDVRINGGATQTVGGGDLSATLKFPGVSPVGGVISIEFRRASSSIGNSYISAAQIIENVPVPTVTLDAAPQLGATLSFTYANYAGIPVGPLAFDQGARSLPDEAVTITDNGDGSGSGVTDTALPGLPANGESVTPFPLIGENITITLPDPGA